MKQFGLSTGSVGAIAELIVSVDLMKRGYEVFRALSQACSCDLLALKHGVAIRVEVRSASYNKNGTIGFARSNIRGEQIAAVTHSDGVIHYIPELL